MLALTAGPRNIKSGKEFDKFFPLSVLRTDPIVIRNGTVEDSVRVMAEVAEKYKSDTERISQILRSDDLNTTCDNIWSFIYSFIQYREDKEGVEQIRRPARSWLDRTSGVDCDCMSVFASSILRNLGIPHKFRITKYNKPDFQHVYVIVPVPGNPGYLTIDGVIDGYNREKQFKESKDFDMNGIPIQLLNGFGKVTDDPLFEYLKMLQQICLKAGEKKIQVSQSIACCDAGDLLQYAITNWHNPHDRAAAIMTNAQLEQKNWPELKFWQTIWNYLEGNATVYDVYQATYILPASKEISLSGDDFVGPIAPEWWNNYDPGTSSSSVNPYNFNWNDLFGFAGNTLNIISNWGKNTQNNPNQNYIQPSPQPVQAGMSTTTMLIVGGMLLIGGLIFFGSKPQQTKSIPAATKAKQNKQK
jgi:hypothetical protein